MEDEGGIYDLSIWASGNGLMGGGEKMVFSVQR